MKTILLTIILVYVVCFGANGQNKPSKQMFDNRNCIYKPKHTAAERLNKYPFNAADTIKLISFRHHYKKYPLKEDTLIKDSLIETKVLTKIDINQLTDILYNNFYRGKNRLDVITQCFSPRNAIVFLDKNGSLKEFILICFHCENYTSKSDNYNLLGDACSQKIDKLRKFFIGKGVKYGTDLNVESYPGETSLSEGVIAPPIKD
jgi:hypothetical protein